MENNDFLRRFLEHMSTEELIEYKEFVNNELNLNNDILKLINEILEERGI